LVKRVSNRYQITNPIRRRPNDEPPSRDRILRGEVHVHRLLDFALGNVLAGVVLVNAFERAIPDDLRLVIAFAV
jgi:hypothetical protein